MEQWACLLLCPLALLLFLPQVVVVFADGIKPPMISFFSALVADPREASLSNPFLRFQSPFFQSFPHLIYLVPVGFRRFYVSTMTLLSAIT
jgi:hypothetical protein